MNELFIDYRDPLFGMIIIVAVIFIISFLTYSFGLFKERKSRQEYRKLLKRFEIENLKEDDFVHLYTTYNLPFDSIILLASSFLHKGNYNKAISVYLALLEVVDDKVKKEELLELLGNAYFKGGFVHRAKEIYLKIVKFSPGNKEILSLLLIVYEKLKEYENANEVLIVLDELEFDIKLEKVYIQTLMVINDPLIFFEKKSLILLEIFTANTSVEKLVVQFLLKYNKQLFWSNCDQFNLSNCVDLLWFLDFNDINFNIVNKHKILQELYTAKGYIMNADTSDIFELAVLISTKKSTSKIDVNLNFEFLCTKCKKTHPMYESRCPHCQTILTFKVKPTLAKQSPNMLSFL